MARGDGRSRAWILALDDATPLPSWALGALVAAAAVAASRVLVRAAGAEPGPLFGYDAALAVMLSVQAGYVLAVLPPAVREAQRQLRRLEPLLLPAAGGAARWERRLTHHRRALLRALPAVGVVAAPAFQELAAGRVSAYLREGPTALGVFASLCALFYWVTLQTGLVVLVSNAATFRRLGGEAVAVDLFRPASLGPFVRMSLMLALVVAGVPTVQAALLVLLGGPPEVHPALPVILVASYCALALAALLLPLSGIHRAIGREKAAAIADLEARLPPHAEAVDRIDAEGAGVVRESLDLLSLRDRIAAVSEWPLTAPNLLRFTVYLLLPLASWIAAALVERELDRALQ